MIDIERLNYLAKNPKSKGLPTKKKPSKPQFAASISTA